MDKPTKVFYPILFAAFPIVFLYSQNIGEVSLKSFLSPLAIVLVMSMTLLIGLSFGCKNKHKAGLIVTAFWAYFFMYANVFGFFRGITLGGLDLHNHSFILPAWTVLFAAYTLAVMKWKYNLTSITKIANIVAVCLIVTSSVTIVYRIMKNSYLEDSTIISNKQNNLAASSKSLSDLPDIYYIILDQHASNDVLKTYFNYDNTAFASDLRQRGFYFAEKSRSNYSQTRLSLASSLNLQYLDNLAARYGADSSVTKPMIDMIRHNQLTKFLNTCGYKIATFSSGYAHTELRNSDVFLSTGWTMDEYQTELLNNTVLLPFIKHKMTYEGHRRQILFPLENITKVTDLNSPVFTFIHIVCPHPPYVFDENGNATSGNKAFSWSDDLGISAEVRNEKYLAQVKFIDRRITETIDVILEKSENPPLIILQSDHGTRWKFETSTSSSSTIDYKPYFGILNAYYLPGFDQTKLYNSITPVNSFRLILNHYFETDLEVLEDKTYYSTYKKPYGFIETTENSDRTLHLKQRKINE